jgi:hypothetical protein
LKSHGFQELPRAGVSFCLVGKSVKSPPNRSVLKSVKVQLWRSARPAQLNHALFPSG